MKQDIQTKKEMAMQAALREVNKVRKEETEEMEKRLMDDNKMVRREPIMSR